MIGTKPDTLLPVIFGSTQSTITELGRIAEEIQSRLGIPIPPATKERVEILLSRFRDKEGITRFSNTEVAIRAAFIIELRQSYPFPIDKIVAQTGSQYTMVMRFIKRICKSLNMSLAPVDQTDIIGQLYESLSLHIPTCPPESSFRHDVTKLSSACSTRGYLSATRSPTTSLLACSCFVIKSRSPDVTLKQCIDAVSLGKSEKTCYRDHAQVKNFINNAAKITNTSDLRHILDNIDKVNEQFQIRDNIRNRIKHT